MTATLALEDGRAFTGRPFGCVGEASGEVVFNTSMFGYQEILTDPSYAGQIVVMTYPHIGNYGTNSEDSESRKPFVEGFAAREFSAVSSNWRSILTLDEYMQAHGIVGISEIDTRALVRHIRSRGALRGIISSTDGDAGRLVERARGIRSMVGSDLASTVSCTAPYEWEPGNSDGNPLRVVAYDFGIKRNILRQLAGNACKVTACLVG